jgi:hypothetical protein
MNPYSMAQPCISTTKRIKEECFMKLKTSLAFASYIAGMCDCASALASPLVLNPGTYALVVETVLPHLEENLRYATTHQRRCLGTEDATTLFPILRHQAFTGCTLTGGRAVEGRLEYALVCVNPKAATGTATLTVSPAALTGVIEIKMGGKNMTLSQRIAGARLGTCEPAR